MGIQNKTSYGLTPVQQNRNPGNAKKRPLHGSLDDLLYLHKASGPEDYDHIESLASDTLDSATFADLFNKSFSKLDPQHQGITQVHLGKLIMRPDMFGQDEYVMLLLLAKYFDTIANLVDGDKSRITHLHKEVLNQFLVHGKLTLAELARWTMLCVDPNESAPSALPPLSGI
jgi:hypothetical protein